MKIEKLDYFGRGISRENNKICFIVDALPKEDVEIEKTKENKKIIEAKVLKYIKISPNRVNAPCKYFNICGGCSLMNMSYDSQVEYKKNKVEEIFKNYAGIDIKINDFIKSEPYNYRNKITLHVEKDKLGFYQESSNNLVEIDKCLLVDEKINSLINVLKDYIKNELEINKIVIKMGNITNEIMLLIYGKVNNYEKIIDYVDVLIINGKTVSNKSSIFSYIGDKKYQISENSFFQVNRKITEEIYNEILKNVCQTSSKRILDLYSGTGTIGIYVSKYASSVVGIEVVSDAVNDANINKKLNNITNIRFIEGKVEDVIEKIDDSFDMVIVDPPRKGLHKNAIELLERINSKYIVYVSCNPITLARDVKLLSEKYNINSIKLFDMFPNSYHVESLCLLEIR